MQMQPTHYKLFILSLTLICSFSAKSLFADVISNQVSPDIQEPTGTYNQGGLNVINMTVDTVISSGQCVTGNYAGCTLNDVLNDIDASDNFKPEVKVHFIADDFPDDGKLSNATLRLRGLVSRTNPQKSFRIKLDSKKNLWRKERRIQLVKAMYDFTRVRNKLSYDLFAEIPHLPSMRTQFVQLTINDNSLISQGLSSDFGLYTHAEHLGKEYLKRRGWDKDSRVYKAENLYFHEDPALALDANGAPLDINAFENILEIKRGKVHFNLINMLRDLNDPSKNFNTQVMGKYFNRDNYLTWLAVNILVNNYDTTYHNFYLFNPKANEHFYLIPWDYDLAWGQNIQDPTYGRPEQMPRWWYSHARWWNISLHKAFLRQPGNLDLLKSAVLEIKNKYLSPSKILAKSNSYYDLVFPILTRSPDWDNIYVDGNTNPERIAEFNRIFSDLANNVEQNYARFIARADDPMPFTMKKPIFQANNNIKFSWSESISLNNQAIVYDIDIATSKEFAAGTIVESVTNISGTDYTLHWTHALGDYFYRVRSRDANNANHWQEAKNLELSYDNGIELFGVSKITITGIDPVLLQANQDQITATSGIATTIDVVANDTGNNNISISWFDNPSNGSITVVNNKLVYTSNQGFIGTEDLWYQIVDSSGQSDWGNLLITVIAGGNNILHANNDTVTVKRGNTVFIDALANDSGTDITLAEVDDVWSGSISIVNGKIKYVASGNTTSTVDVWYSISDGNNEDWALISINITP